VLEYCQLAAVNSSRLLCRLNDHTMVLMIAEFL
jgi:hypothetical protein